MKSPRRKPRALLTVAGLLGGMFLSVPTAPAHADPCFFGAGEFDNWYNGARWGDTLSHVENAYANCVGTWEDTPMDWNGHNEKIRIWPRSDGLQTRIWFAYMNGAWHAHDTADTGLGGSNARIECEWPRPSGNPCTPTA